MTAPHHHVFNAIQPRINSCVPVQEVLPHLLAKGVINSKTHKMVKMSGARGMKVVTSYLRNQNLQTFLDFVECLCIVGSDPTASKHNIWPTLISIEEVVKDFDVNNGTEHCSTVTAILGRYQKPPQKLKETSDVEKEELVGEAEGGLVETYQEFFPKLIEAFSDDQTHHSLVSELYSRLFISEEEKVTQMSSKQHSKARASSLLVVLRVEEKPHLLTELITVMKEVEELKTLAEEMSAHLRKTQQGFGKTHGENEHEDAREKLQVEEAANVQQKANKEDLSDQLRCLEEALRQKEKDAEQLKQEQDTVVAQLCEQLSDLKKSHEKVVEESEARKAQLAMKQSRIDELEELISSQESEKSYREAAVQTSDQLPGIHVVDEMVFEVKGYGAQTLLWEKHEFRMHIPAEALSSSETCLVFVKAITTGLFKFPVGTEPVSAIYAISLSKMFNKPVKLELQHCVRLGQSKFMTFAVAPQDMRSLPYEFQPVAGGVFDQKEFFGSVDRHQFSFVAIFWDWLQYMLYSKNKQTPDPDPIIYHAMTFKMTESENTCIYLWLLAVSKDLSTMKEHVLSEHSNMAKQEAEIQFSFEEEGKLTVRIGSPVTPGWKIQPLATPCIIEKKHVDMRDPKCGPKSLKVRISAEKPDDPPTAPLDHTIRLDGISPTDASFYIYFLHRATYHRSDSDASTTSDVIPSSQPQLEDDQSPAQGKFYKLVIQEIPAKWHLFGVILGIPISRLDAIEVEDRDLQKCFLKVFSIWHDELPRPFTWTTALEVLKDMNEKRIIRNINKQLAI